jgi:hypothetical protein
MAGGPQAYPGPRGDIPQWDPALSDRPDAESSGSLSGHLLGRGEEPHRKSGSARTAIVLLTVVVLLIAAGLAVAFFGRDWLSGVLGNG